MKLGSKIWNNDLQAALPAARREPLSFTTDQVIARPTLQQAINFSQEIGRIEDKDASVELQIDVSHFSKIKKEQRFYFPPNKILTAQRLFQNVIPTLWLVHHSGFDPDALVRRKSELERENEVLKQRLAEMQHERDIEVRLMRELRK